MHPQPPSSVKAASLQRRIPNPPFYKAVNGDLEKIEARTVIDLAKAGDPDCVKLFDNYIYHLTVGIVNLINMYDPEIIALGGGVSHAGDFLLVHAGLGNFYPERKLRQYKPDDLLWHRPRIGEQYFDDITTILGHTPVRRYSDVDNRAFHNETWIDIDVGVSGGNHPMLLRLDDMKEFYLDD